MSEPKFRRKKIVVNPNFAVPPGIEEVETEEFYTQLSGVAGVVENGFVGPIAVDPVKIDPTDKSPVTNPGAVNPWGVAKLIEQTLVIDDQGKMLAEVTFELKDWPEGYTERISRG